MQRPSKSITHIKKAWTAMEIKMNTSCKLQALSNKDFIVENSYKG